MFKYSIINEKEAPEGFGGYISRILIETKNKNEFEKKLKDLNIEENVKNFLFETRQSYKHFVGEVLSQDIPEEDIIPVVFSTFIYRKPIGPDLVVEVEYYPIEEIIKEIEKETAKKIELKTEKKIIFSKSKTPKQIILRQYNPNQKSKYDFIFAYSINKPNSKKVEELIELFTELWNDYIS